MQELTKFTIFDRKSVPVIRKKVILEKEFLQIKLQQSKRSAGKIVSVFYLQI